MPAKFPERREFIALIAITMMVVAFGIDTMLPALPAMARDLGAAHANDQQFVLTAFTVALGVSTFVVGILSDSLGRRRLLLGALIGYAVFGVAAALAPSFDTLLVARAFQGMAAGAASVLAGAIVRDRYEGREMARINSLTAVVFMAAPVIAPTLGTLVLAVSGWRTIFVVLAIFGITTFAWVGRRLPESLAPAARVPLRLRSIVVSARHVLSDRLSVGYSIAIMLIQSTVFAYLASVQQIFDAVYDRPGLLPIGFAVMAAGIAAGSLLNSRIVVRLGMQRIGHVALLFFAAVAALNLYLAASGVQTLVIFVVGHAIMMIAFPMTIGNFSALAMSDMGEVAGTASSLQRSFTTVLGAIGGTLIGQQFNGTNVPLYAGITVAIVIAIGVVLVVERGRLFGDAPLPASAT